MYHEVTEKFILEITILNSKLLCNGACGYQSEKKRTFYHKNISYCIEDNSGK